MLWRRIGLGATLTIGLVAIIGKPATVWGQSGGAAFYSGSGIDANPAATNFTPLPAVGEDGGQIPLVADAMIEPVALVAPLSPNAQVAALEARVAEMDAQLQSRDLAAAPDKGYVIGSDTTMTGKWAPDGLTFSSKNGDFKYHMRGVAQLDYIGLRNPTGLTTPGGAGTQDAVDFRRLRVGAEGTMYETIDWVFEFDFAFALQNIDQANSSTPAVGLRSTGVPAGSPLGTPANVQGGNVVSAIQPTTIFMTFKDLPILSNVRVGNQPNWLSLEHIESARFQDFMERSPLMDAFNGANNNGYAPGISAFRTTENKKASLEIGAYANNMYTSGYPYTVANNAFIYGGRTHWTPYYDEITDGRYMLHLGFGSEFRTFNTELPASQDGTNVRVRARGDLRNTDSVLDPNFADTGNFYATNQTVFAPELAFQWGSLLIQAEYNRSYFGGAAATQGGTSLGNVMFQGGYVEGLYFLTGENRQYNRQAGVFNRVIPIQNASIVKGAGFCGWGAWQVGARCDWLDLNSGAINGGNLTNYTLGLNWFLNPNARIQFNYVYSMIDGTTPAIFPGTVGSLAGSRFAGHGDVDSLGTRLDFNF